jgi:hypothetical protein
MSAKNKQTTATTQLYLKSGETNSDAIAITRQRLELKRFVQLRETSLVQARLASQQSNLCKNVLAFCNRALFMQHTCDLRLPFSNVAICCDF